MPDVQIEGVEFSSLTEDEANAAILEALAAGRGGWVVTPNLDIVRQARGDASIMELVKGADLVLADGVPVIWASRLQGTPLPEQVAGSSLIFTLSARAAERGASVFLLGGDPGVAEKAADGLRGRFAGLRVAGTYSPPFGFESDPAEITRIADALAHAEPDIVFVGLGFPKQERLTVALRPMFPATWFLGVGIALSFAAGEIPRAPALLRRAGLEWLYRLVQEPRRLFRRYVVHGVPFAGGLFTRVLLERRRGGRRQPPV